MRCFPHFAPNRIECASDLNDDLRLTPVWQWPLLGVSSRSLARKLKRHSEQRNKRERGYLFDQKHTGFYACFSVSPDYFVKYFCIKPSDGRCEVVY